MVALRSMLVATGRVSAEAAKLYSVHSFRRYLACALLAAGCSDSRIQALLRWKTTESLRIYATLNYSEYGGWLQQAAASDVTSVQVLREHLSGTTPTEPICRLLHRCR